MALLVQVQVKNVYGKELVYPVNEQAKLFAQVEGTKTLSARTLKVIKALGYSIQTVTQDVQF